MSQLVAGRYRVVRRIGAGGMASVLLGEDERLGRQVALKRLHPFGTDELVARLRREARIGASLNHPNIVRIFDVVAGDEGVWIVMEYVEGESLADAVVRAPLPPSRALVVLRAVAAALDHVHERGVVHRDVKPANVLLGRDGRVKLTDLGIATALDATRLTQTGSALGSVAYMAPEQLEGGRVTAAADVHALAAVAFEVLSGRRARTATAPAAIVAEVVEGTVPDLRDAWPDARPEAAAVLQRGMARDPVQRPATAGELVEDLAAALRPPAPAPRPVTPREPRAAAAAPAPARRQSARWLVPLALLAVLALGIGAAVLGRGDDEGGATRAGTTAARSGTGDEPATATSTEPAPEDGGAGGTGGGTTGGGTTGGGGSTGGGGTGSAAEPPAAAVAALYTAAARQDTATVCAGLSPRFKQRFSCPGVFTTQFGTLRGVEFPQLQVTERQGDTATVALSTIARHTNRTDRCAGTAALVRQDGRWLLDALDVAC